MCVKIDIRGRRPQYACCFYRSDVNDLHSLTEFKKCIEKILNEVKNPLIWIFGDFNLPGMKWSDTDPPAVTPHCTQITSHRDFLEFLNENGLKQMVTSPTRRDNVLDLFMTNNHTLVNNVKVIPGISDHNAVLIDMEIKKGQNIQKPRRIPLWKKTETYLPPMKQRLDDEWNKVSNETKSDPELLWTWFRTTIEKAINDFVPHRQASKKDQKPWMSRDLKRMLQKEKRMFSRKKKSRTRHNTCQLKDIQSKI